MSSTTQVQQIQAIDASSFHGDKSKIYGRDSNGRLVLAGDDTDSAYPHFLPVWDPNEHYEPLTEFKFSDPGLRADPSLPNLFSKLNTDLKVKSLTPKFGSEVRGIQLSELTSEGKDELALFVAKRGVVVFREQDLKDKPIDWLLAYSSHFGRNHIHPTSGAPLDHPEVHLVYRSKTEAASENTFFQDHVSSVAWHSDVTYEKQPPGTTFLAILDGPESGGDTIFADTQEAYNRLSEAFRQRLHGLEVFHSGVAQANAARNSGGVVRREPVENFHPLIREHPVTKKNAIFVNQQFSRHIKDLKREESDAILGFLYDFLAKSADLQVRASWEPGTVVVWDNRRSVHSALVDWSEAGSSRHAFRLTPQAERPYETEPQSV
ncbi:hypothetical protein V1525DRAFT_407574 [Lipomyces kononenkoae]|uniref:Uncharacterized protein n=1 Tax=Lipomyces kononenkoae TaxID=34357 RepID=A0ACC3SX28_LIPKO